MHRKSCFFHPSFTRQFDCWVSARMSVGRWISLEARVSFKVTGGIEITVLRMAAAAALKDAAFEDQGGMQ